MLGGYLAAHPSRLPQGSRLCIDSGPDLLTLSPWLLGPALRSRPFLLLAHSLARPSLVAVVRGSTHPSTAVNRHPVHLSSLFAGAFLKSRARRPAPVSPCSLACPLLIVHHHHPVTLPMYLAWTRWTGLLSMDPGGDPPFVRSLARSGGPLPRLAVSTRHHAERCLAVAPTPS